MNEVVSKKSKPADEIPIEVSEAAKIMGVSVATVYRHVKEGKIEAGVFFRVGSAIRFDRGRLQTFIRRGGSGV